tara:strand:+ start:2985 stop:3602 length:618 start_codon:yes stop_codon:yes gene_type:complete
MSKLKKDMEKVHEDTDFKIEFAGTTQTGEFFYTHGGSVPSGLDYHIHYTNKKREVFMTGGIHNSESKIINRIINNSMFNTYSKLQNIKKQSYPSKSNPKPTESDYRIGTYKRYFAQKANNLDSELFEISQDNFEINNLYRYISITWKVTGLKSEVFNFNTNQVLPLSEERGNEQLLNILSPLQYWNPPKGSVDDIQEKLSRRKIM